MQPVFPYFIEDCHVSDAAVLGVVNEGMPLALSALEIARIGIGTQGLGLMQVAMDQAIAYAKRSGKVSTSGIQRHLRISYPRAARLMEQMEKMGLVEPQVSAGRKRRVILGGDEDS